ncbi:hypothetical protein GCM10023325_16580 [Sphingomonas lutea]
MALAQAGQAGEGLALLRAAQARGEADAFLLEGLWLIEGRFAPRDPAAARAALGKAAELGHVGAARTLAGLVACGVGGDPDWQGAQDVLRRWAERDAVAAQQLALIARMDLDADGIPRGDYPLQVVHDDPRVARHEGLLSADECDFLITLAEPRMRRATIFHDELQRFVEDPVRRSDKSGFPLVSEWPFVRAINRRIAAATGTSVEQGEPLQVLRYAETQEYRPHFDAVAGMDNPRILTALVWLNEDYAGGETSFPDIGIEARGKTGDLLVFANTDAEQRPDPRMRHAGRPVTAGVKFLASRWIRARPPGPEGFGRHEVER